VGFDRCGFSPNGLEGVLCLLNFFYCKRKNRKTENSRRARCGLSH
jgi:hypothetical protein